MENFLKQIVEWSKFELVIDKNIFNKDIVLKAAYNFLDKWYFFFKIDSNENIILVFTKREESKETADEIIANFSDELISVYLRDKLEHDNKEIREMIVWAAIANSLDSSNYVEFDSNNWYNEQNQIDFDKDIDDILREIENDPELKIDEEEIEKILREIESESNINKAEKQNITLNVDALNDIKNKFKSNV